ncbi:MAG: cupin domain-containing protein [Pseudomonadota bacterium]
MTASQVIRLLPNGPDGAGLEPMEINPADFQQAPDEQRIHVFYEDDAKTFAVGVWTTTDMQEAFGPYPGDEFMVVLEGRVEMLDGDGGATPVKTGEAFAVRNGAPLSWKQTGFLRKAFLLMSNAGEHGEVSGQDVTVVSPAPGAITLVEAEEQIGGGHQHESVLHRNDTGNIEAGIWETTAFRTELEPFSVHEFAHIIEGSVTITETDGRSHVFNAGDSLFIPAGTVCSWESDGPVRKYFATVRP